MLPMPHEICCRWCEILQIRYWILRIFLHQGNSSREDESLRRFSWHCKGGGGRGVAQNLGMSSSLTEMPFGINAGHIRGESTRYLTQLRKVLPVHRVESTFAEDVPILSNRHFHCQSANLRKPRPKPNLEPRLIRRMLVSPNQTLSWASSPVGFRFGFFFCEREVDVLGLKIKTPYQSHQSTALARKRKSLYKIKPTWSGTSEKKIDTRNFWWTDPWATVQVKMVKSKRHSVKHKVRFLRAMVKVKGEMQVCYFNDFLSIFFFRQKNSTLTLIWFLLPKETRKFSQVKKIRKDSSRGEEGMGASINIETPPWHKHISGFFFSWSQRWTEMNHSDLRRFFFWPGVRVYIHYMHIYMWAWKPNSGINDLSEKENKRERNE